jgi:hypothetical protein
MRKDEEMDVSANEVLSCQDNKGRIVLFAVQS